MLRDDKLIEAMTDIIEDATGADRQAAEYAARAALSALTTGGYVVVPAEPVAYALRYTDLRHQYWIGIWNDRAIAERMRREHGEGGTEIVVAVYAAPQPEEAP